jgi:serine/threonine protein kinase
MVCGRPPFVVQTIFEACNKHLHAAPPAPHSLVDGLPDDLDDVIVRLLAKDPADRAVSMGQISRALEAIATEQDISAIPERVPRRDSQPVAAQSSRAIVTPPTLTTLGATAAEIQATQRRTRPAMVGGLIAGVLVLALVIFVLTRPSGTDAPSAPSAPIEPTTQPTVAPPTPPVTPPTPPVTPPTPPVTPPTPPPVLPPTPPVVNTTKPPVTRPPHHPPPPHAIPPDAGVTHVAPPPPPPPNGSDVGGRL